MSEKFNALIDKLREIFQINNSELDFGIYRIINARAEQIDDFLKNKLAAKVRAALAGNTEAEKAALEARLNEAVAGARAAGVPEENSPKVKELREKIAKLANASDESEAVVYSHLLTFFSRYYDNGDFISKRRYKGDVYAVPYAGEEVKLHWANADQYYTKSGENFTNYDFKLSDGARVHFKLVKADTAKDNIKDNDAVRCFVLWNPENVPAQAESEEKNSEASDVPAAAPEYPADFLEEKSGELFIYFQYLKFPKKTKQEAFIAETVKKIAAKLGEKQLLQKFNLLALEPTEKNKNRTRLEKELTRYTAKNSSDYFIHKDLKTFLTRELDFYIKNEMLHLDDIQHAEAFRQIEAGLRQIQTMRTIALELIAFMEQLEDFQKKLWLKKKFVVRADYCLTLDRVPEKFHKEIFANEAQLAEWEKLGFPSIGRSELFPENASAEIGEKYDSRMVDTKFFPPEFKEKLLAEIDELDESCDGLLIRSENFQALNFLRERYREKIKCIYIDPPYNTGNDGFLYRDNYQHSSWLTMMEDRLRHAREHLSDDGVIFISIDDNEQAKLKNLCDKVFGEEGLVTSIPRLTSPQRSGQERFMNISHDYVLTYTYADKFNFVISRDLNNKNIQKDKNGTYIEGDTKAILAAVSQGYSQGGDYDFQYNGKVYSPIDKKGVRNRWLWKKERMEAAAKLGILVETKSTLRMRIYLDKKFDESTNTLVAKEEKLIFHTADLMSKNDFTNPSGDKEIKSMALSFAYPKPSDLIKIFCGMGTSSSSTILDYFAGSGTTGHAVINLNREDGGKRKYILVEMGEHFETVLKPRIEKVVYSPNWKDGKPQDSDKGVSHAFKYLTLESYEDTLNNLHLAAAGSVPALLRDEYLLHYMLDVESRGSLLSTEDFKKPFDYALDIATDSSGATARTPIDLVETFNYLLGLTVKKIYSRRERGFVTVEGVLPSGKDALIFWRDCEKIDNAKLNEILKSHPFNPNDSEFAVYYVNGDHAVENISVGEDGNEKRKKVLQIEDEFLKRMFKE